MLQTFLSREWEQSFSSSEQKKATESLESGQILVFPDLNFKLSPEEQYFLSPDHADPQSKNISYHPKVHKLWGVQRLTDNERIQLIGMLDRYSYSATKLLQQLFPRYQDYLMIGRTSFRPVQISGRRTSYRKDDKRLHVDAFPSAPNQGRRILRVFCNINPHGEERLWRVGEPFSEVVEKFLPKIKKPLPGSASLLRMLRITKSYRTLYDHYMLHIHDLMKADESYQKQAQQQEVRFPSGCSWIVQTDDVSHAAMKGQYVLEQTFYLPVAAMDDEAKSPLRILESRVRAPLV